MSLRNAAAGLWAAMSMGAALADGADVALSATTKVGSAPLAVLFDATSTRAMKGVDAFHAIEYQFDFGDERGAVWEVSGKPKNVQRGGPLAAHVFDTPGTYVVRVSALVRGAVVGTASLSITVEDPDALYAGSKTVCVSAKGDFDNCPSGAAKRTKLPSGFAGKRVLLRRGEHFDAIKLSGLDDKVQIGAFGRGDKPRVARVEFGGNGKAAQWPDEVTVADLAIVDGLNLEVTGSRILLYRNDINTPVTGSDSQVNIGTAVGYYADHGSLPAASYYWPREIFLVENDIQGKADGEKRPNGTVMGWFMKSALLGNRIDRATEHSLRIWAAHKIVIAHNMLGGEHYAPKPPGVRQALKIHSAGTLPYRDTLDGGKEIATSQVVIADNRIGSPRFMGSWLCGIGPQNADPGTVEGLEDIIAERNVFTRGPHTMSEIQWRGRRMTSRGNSLSGGGVPHIVRNGSRFDRDLDGWDGPYLSR